MYGFPRPLQWEIIIIASCIHRERHDGFTCCLVLTNGIEFTRQEHTKIYEKRHEYKQDNTHAARKSMSRNTHTHTHARSNPQQLFSF